MTPLTLANKVSSLPRPTLAPGLIRVPRWRTMMVPPGTSCPPNAFTPNRCALESRPFLELPKPFLCAITKSLKHLGFEQLAVGKLPVAAFLLLFAFAGLLSRSLRPRLTLSAALFVRSSFGLVRVGFTFGLLRRLGFHLQWRRIGRGVLLTVKSDLSDTHCCERLAMSKDLFVLLFAFEMEDQNFVGASGIHYLAAYDRALTRTDMTFLAGDSEHVVEFDSVTVAGGHLLDLYYISRSNPILFSPGANHRVHNSLQLPLASVRPERT